MSFRNQFIFDVGTMEIVGVEILAANPAELRLDDPDAMLAHDLKAIRFARDLAEVTRLRVQCNVEPLSFRLGRRRMLKDAGAGVVIEIVERHEHLSDQGNLDNVFDVARQLKKMGVLLALDDVTPTDLEVEMIRVIRPDIIKVENRDALSRVLEVATTRHLIAERVETEEHARLIKALGVREMQGFWCDRALADSVQRKLAASHQPITASTEGIPC